MHDIVETLLQERGICTEDERTRFLQPSYERDTHDPFLLSDMDKAVVRILQAIEKREHIAIYADFDADGIPGAVVLHDFFKKIGHDACTVYIPHRDTEGFGFHEAAVEALAEKGVQLIITVDVGITGVAATARANECGLDVIITDHHLPDATTPAAYAIVNPVLGTYPFPKLCGAAVAYKVVQALIARLHEQRHSLKEKVPKEWEKWLLDMVGIATIADMVPLVGENRTLAYFGLQVLRKTRRPGLRALLRTTRVRMHTLTEDDIGFSIAPRINAASRMDRPDDAFALLTAIHQEEAETLARHLESLNRKRKTAVAQIVKQANARIEANAAPMVLVGNPDWKPAFLGLAAQSLAQTYGKTACVWGREASGTLKGSCRSPGDVALPDLFAAAKDALVQYGGHEKAGGFSFEEAQVHTLKQSFEAAHKKACVPSAEQPNTKTNVFSLSPDALSEQMLRTLSVLAPFGVENEKPVFSISGTVQSTRRFGKHGEHFECVVRGERKNIRVIAFFSSAAGPAPNTRCTVTGTCERDLFKGGIVLHMHTLN